MPKPRAVAGAVTVLRLTLTRLSDGTYDLLSDAGAPIARNVSLDEAIDQIVT